MNTAMDHSRVGRALPAAGDSDSTVPERRSVPAVHDAGVFRAASVVEGEQ
jgi:hypothetical protein